MRGKSKYAKCIYYYFKPFNKYVTFVEVKIKNGFTIRETTTYVDPTNYNEEIGKDICLKRIEDKIWLLLGYALQEKLKITNSYF